MKIKTRASSLVLVNSLLRKIFLFFGRARTDTFSLRKTNKGHHLSLSVYFTVRLSQWKLTIFSTPHPPTENSISQNYPQLNSRERSWKTNEVEWTGKVDLNHHHHHSRLETVFGIRNYLKYIYVHITLSTTKTKCTSLVRSSAMTSSRILPVNHRSNNQSVNC